MEVHTKRRPKTQTVDPDVKAQAMIELTEKLNEVINREAARLVCDEIEKLQAILFGVSNTLSVISAGLRAGSLPKQIKDLPEENEDAE